MLNLNSHSLVDWPALQTFCWLGYVPQKWTFGDSWSRFITGQMAFMSANHVEVVKGIIWLCQRFESVNRCSVSTWHMAGFYGMNLCRLFIVLVLTVKLTAVTRNCTKAHRSLLHGRRHVGGRVGNRPPWKKSGWAWPTLEILTVVWKLSDNSLSIKV